MAANYGGNLMLGYELHRGVVSMSAPLPSLIEQEFTKSVMEGKAELVECRLKV